MDQITSKKMATLMGVFVADAAALGLHWLYDAERLAEIAEEEDDVAFLAPDPMRFKNASGEFSNFYHPGKSTGDLSHYGNYLKVALSSLAATGGKADPADLQKRFAAYFGPGGAYDGYIDHATSGTLGNIAGGGDSPPLESGVDDDQIPALGSVAAMAAADPSPKSLSSRIAPMVRVTSINALAGDAAQVAAHVIAALINGADIAGALEAGITVAGDELKPRLQQAIAYPAGDLGAMAKEFGRACPLGNSLPLSFGILAQAENYADGVRANTAAGGDNCGRALLVGAALGARYGFGGEDGIPLEWLMRVTDAPQFYDDALHLCAT